MTENNLLPNFSTQIINKVDALKNLPRTHPGLFWILVFTVLSRITVYIMGQPWNQDVVEQEILDGDALVYDRIARGFIDGFWITDMPWAANRTFGYPFFLTSIYAISNNAIWPVLALQTLMNIVMVPMIYLITKNLFRSQQSGTFAAALFALSAIPLAWAARFLFTETLFTFLFLTFIMVYLHTWKSESLRWFLLIGVLLGIGAIIRSVLQFFVVIPILIVLMQDRTIRRKILVGIAVLIGLLVTIAPFQIINHQKYGHYSLSTISGDVLFKSIAQAKAITDGTNVAKARDSLGQQNWKDVENPFDRSAIAKGEGIKYLLKQPKDFAYLHLLGMVSFLIGTEKSSYLYVIAKQERQKLSHQRGFELFSERIIRNLKDFQKEYFLTPILVVKLLVEYALVAAGLLVLIRRKQKTLALFLILSIGYFIFVTAFQGRAPRYKIPVLPLYAIIGGGGAILIKAYLNEWIDSLKRKS
jgi:4-amino-4-deoxy-L-arabinose transferase-like glycosyltransferase